MPTLDYNIDDELILSYNNGELEIPCSFFTPNQGGIELSFSTDASRVSVPIQVEWDQWREAYWALLGWSVKQTDGQYTWISRINPTSLPGLRDFYGNAEWLYAVSVPRIEGIGPRGADQYGLPMYDLARLHTTFTNLTYEIQEDGASVMLGELGANPDEGKLERYVTGPLFRPSNRQITVRRALAKSELLSGDLAPPSGPGQNVLTEGFGFPEPGAEVVYNWHQVPEDAVPWKAINTAMGQVNIATFDRQFPAETLLCEAPDITPRTSAIGQRIYDIQYRFRYLPRAARHNPNAGTPRGWNWLLSYVKRDLGGPKPTGLYDYRRYSLELGEPAFGTFDFKKLFRPDQPE